VTEPDSQRQPEPQPQPQHQLRSPSDQGTASEPSARAAAEAAPAGDALAEILAAAEEDAGRIVDVDQPTQQFVVVRLGEQRFAFRGEQITKILAYAPIWPVPGCPQAVDGVIDVRGEVWSVMGLAALIGIERVQPRRTPHAGGGARASGHADAHAGAHSASGVILLGRSASMASGLRVDEVIDVLTLELSHVRPLPDTLPEDLQPIATGLLDDPLRTDARVLILDLEPLFERWLASLR
jgi:purine-binding chemotaxis protein CheW